MPAVFERIRAEWGRLDFAIHSIAYAPREDLHGRVVDCSQAGFLQAMQVSCHSFLDGNLLAKQDERSCASICETRVGVKEACP